jgi:hypothetical protein
MHDRVGESARRLTAFLLTLALELAACSGAATPSADSNGGTTSSAASSSAAASAAGGDAGAQPSPGAVDVQGSLVSSGLYDAT